VKNLVSFASRFEIAAIVRFQRV